MQEDEENNHIMKAMSGQYDRLTNVEEAVDDFQDDPATPLENGADQIDLFEDEPTDDLVSASPSNASRPTSSRRIRSGDSWYHSCLLSDERFSICGIELLDGSPAVRLVKFVCVTISAICLMHQFLRVVDWEHKESFTLELFWTYESTQVISDALVFFIVARLWKQRGVDHIVWVFWVTASNLFMSYLPNFRFLQASFTLYDMHCRWIYKLWIFVAILAPLIIAIVFLHVRYAVRHGFFVRKVLELVLAVAVWFLPYASSPYFHLHHWFAGWWVGMHANYDTWWSRATLAWCWGLYINGIAAYGRDPVLTCGYALFISEQNRCPFLDCYLDGIQEHHPTNHNTTEPIVQPMVKPDWRNCSADAYHP